MSVMCFNAEVWPISNTDAVHLEGVHFRLLRRIVAKTPEEHVTRDRVLRLTEVPPLLALVPKTPAMGWTRPTTCAYRSLSTQCPGPAEQAGVALDTLIQSDCNVANIPIDSLEHLVADRTAFRQLTCARTFC